MLINFLLEILSFFFLIFEHYLECYKNRIENESVKCEYPAPGNQIIFSKYITHG